MTAFNNEASFNHFLSEPVEANLNYVTPNVIPEHFAEPEDVTVHDATVDTGNNETVVAAEDMHDQGQPGFWERSKDFVKRNKGKLALGAVAVSTVWTLTSNPINEIKDEVVETFPVVAAGVVASETAFTVGLGIMAASVGTKIGNPLKLKDQLPAIAAHANDSLLFKTGFWVNTTGAVGTAAVFTAGIVQMPVETYPALFATLADLGVTVAVRKAMLQGIQENAARNTEAGPDEV